MRIHTLLIMLSLSLVPCFTGCSGNADGIAKVATHEAEQSDGENNKGEAGLPSRKNRVEQPAGQSANDDVREAQNPLIRGLRQMLGTTLKSDEFDEERSQLDQSLVDADRLLTRAKRGNREAIRQANRQVRILGPRSPNIVLILANDLGYGDLGCYGQQQIRTPHIDQLANDGMRFTNFYAGGTDGATSRWSLMTGLHTGHTGNQSDEKISLLDEDNTLAEVLWQAGYATGVFGLWGLPTEQQIAVPNQHGFDEWLGYQNDREAADLFPEQLWSNHGQVNILANADGKRALSSLEFFTQEALSFIERRSENRPFFVMLSYPIPGEVIDDSYDTSKMPTEWTPDEMRRAAAVATLDRHVGRIVDRLYELELDYNTAIFLTSDTGPSRMNAGKNAPLNRTGPLRGQKGDLLEGGIRIPLVVRWPNQVYPKLVSKHVSAAWDLMPTMADIASAMRWPRGIDGISLYAELLEYRQDKHEYLAWFLNNNEIPQAARIGNWKVTRMASDKGYEVYDLENDPGEKHNLAATHPEIIAEFEKLFSVSNKVTKR